MATTELGLIAEAQAAQIRSETETAFTDSVPSNAVTLPYGRLLLELPCGVEAEFDRTGDGVRILHLEIGEILLAPLV